MPQANAVYALEGVESLAPRPPSEEDCHTQATIHSAPHQPILR